VDAIATLEKDRGGIITASEGYLRTIVHELGHALNLLHADGRNCCPSVTIMDSTGGTLWAWNYIWSDRSFDHFNHHPLNRMQPGSVTTPTTVDI